MKLRVETADRSCNSAGAVGKFNKDLRLERTFLDGTAFASAVSWSCAGHS